MHRLAVLSLAAAATLSPAGAGVTLRGATSFSVVEAAPHESPLLDGPASLRNAYIKYGVEPPAALVARAVVTATVTATPQASDSTYFVPVAIGSPAATYTMQIDTSSGDFSVYAPKLGKSGSSVVTTVNIGGAIVTKQKVNLVDSNSGGFTPDDNSENIVGILYSGVNFYTNAVNQGIIAPVVTANLKKGAPGTYVFGTIDPASHSGSITYVNVDTSQGLWQFKGNGYAIGSGAFTSTTINAVVDTSTTLLLLPQAIVTAYYNQVSGAKYDSSQGGYTFPCATVLPNLVLGIATYRASVPGSYINYAPTTSGGSTCYGGLQADTDIGFSILGLVFIKSQFVVFTGTSSPTLGFATKP